MFCAGLYPGDREPSREGEKLSALLDAGFLHVVSIMDPMETDLCGRLFLPYKRRLLELADERHLRVQLSHWVVPESCAPGTDVMSEILDAIDRSIKVSRPVYCHSWTGLGRAATVAGCWLARHGIARGRKTLLELDRIMGVPRKKFSLPPQSVIQRDLIKKWKKFR